MCCCCSFSKLYPTLCVSMNCIMPILHYLPEFAQGQWCYLTTSPSAPSSSFCLQSFPASGSFPMSQLFLSGGQSIRVSTSVGPMNIEDWFPLGLADFISLKFKGLSRVFSSNTIGKHQFFVTQPSYGPTLTSIHNYWKNHNFNYRNQDTNYPSGSLTMKVSEFSFISIFWVLESYVFTS